MHQLFPLASGVACRHISSSPRGGIFYLLWRHILSSIYGYQSDRKVRSSLSLSVGLYLSVAASVSNVIWRKPAHTATDGSILQIRYAYMHTHAGMLWSDCRELWALSVGMFRNSPEPSTDHSLKPSPVSGF